MLQKAQWPIWESIRLIILGHGFNSHPSFGQWLKFLTNLANLISHNLEKTQRLKSEEIAASLSVKTGYLDAILPDMHFRITQLFLTMIFYFLWID